MCGCWRVAQAFGREKLLVEVAIEFCLVFVYGQHRSGLFLYGLRRVPEIVSHVPRLTRV